MKAKAAMSWVGRMKPKASRSAPSGKESQRACDKVNKSAGLYQWSRAHVYLAFQSMFVVHADVVDHNCCLM